MAVTCKLASLQLQIFLSYHVKCDLHSVYMCETDTFTEEQGNILCGERYK